MSSFPPSPPTARSIVPNLSWQFHVETNHDYFMAKPTQPWFEGLIWVELLFHVPFFAFATAGFVRQWNAVRIPCIVYGTAAATSVVPIVADVLASDKLTDPQRYKLICICESRPPRASFRVGDKHRSSRWRLVMHSGAGFCWVRLCPRAYVGHCSRQKNNSPEF